MSPIQWLLYNMIKRGTNILCRVDASELGFVPARGPLIIYTNHSGSLEVPLLFAHLMPRPVTGWAKIETWDIPFYGWLFSLWGAIPIHRGVADVTALRKALAALEKDSIFALTPEGTRSWSGQLLRAHPGAVMLALHSGAPLLPLAHWGGERLWSNLKQFRRTDFHIRVGKPFHINTNGATITHQTRQAVADEMMYKIAELLPPEHRGRYSNLQEATQTYLHPLIASKN